jgi:hypothetical protein
MIFVNHRVLGIIPIRHVLMRCPRYISWVCQFARLAAQQLHGTLAGFQRNILMVSGYSKL